MPQSRQRNQRRRPRRPSSDPCPGQTGQRGRADANIVSPSQVGKGHCHGGGVPRGVTGESVRCTDGGLQKAALSERQHAVAGDHEVVEDPHVHQTECSLEVLRQKLVGTARLGHTRGVVVGLMCPESLCAQPCRRPRPPLDRQPCRTHKRAWRQWPPSEVSMSTDGCLQDSAPQAAHRRACGADRATTTAMPATSSVRHRHATQACASAPWSPPARTGSTHLASCVR